MGALGGGVADQDRWPRAGDPAEHRWLAAERCVLRSARVADDLGAALLSRLFAARAERTPAPRDRARRAEADGRDLLGSRRTRGAGTRELIAHNELITRWFSARSVEFFGATITRTFLDMQSKRH